MEMASETNVMLSNAKNNKQNHLRKREFE